MTRTNLIGSVIAWWLLPILFSCQKTNNNQPVIPTPPQGFTLNYGDSVFYIRNQANDYVITPNTQLAGQFSGFPEGLKIDGNTGAIDVTASETGLKYQVSFVPAGTTDTFSTFIIISGINYLDGFYNLSKGDSLVHPLYNTRSVAIPGLNNGSVFDEGSSCNSQGCTVNVGNAEINLAQTVRNGVFGAVPANNARQEFKLNYRINDQSGKALNSLGVKLYYFDTMNDVTQEVYDIISSRQGTILDGNPRLMSNYPIEGMVTAVNSATQINIKSAKPRPPCIFIVSR